MRGWSKILVLFLVFASFMVLYAQDTTDVEEQNKALVENVINVLWNWDRETSIDTLVGEFYAMPFRHNYVGSDGNASTTTRGSWAQWGITQIYDSLPDLSFTIDHMIADGDLVIVQYTAIGTFDRFYSMTEFVVGGGEPDVVEASGETVTWDGVIIYRIQDNMIVEELWYWDRTLIDIFRVDE